MEEYTKFKIRMARQATYLSSKEAYEHGKKCRDKVGRSQQGRWRVRRRDPIKLVVAATQGRLRQLVPIKFDRMAASPFGFFRGAVSVMAADLATTPVSGINAQICGDAHVRNLGSYAAPDARLVFDLNDFDETIWGPWEWDLKRLATSLVLAGREAPNSGDHCGVAVHSFVRAYREAMLEFCKMTVLDLARYRVRDELHTAPVADVLAKAERATPLHNLEKLTEKDKKGHHIFKDLKPVLFRIPGHTARKVLTALQPYRETLSPERQHFLDCYQLVDVAFKVVGTGSVGLRDYIVLLFGPNEDDPLFLQLKEEQSSVYTPYLPRVKGFLHEGRRVVEGQRRMQAQSDIFLGWTSIDGREYLVRQLSDHKASVEVEDLRGEALLHYARICGQVLAKGHARSSHPCVLAGYLGSADKFDYALVKFANAYADQTTSDHEKFASAIRRGALKADSDLKSLRLSNLRQGTRSC